MWQHGCPGQSRETMERQALVQLTCKAQDPGDLLVMPHPLREGGFGARWEAELLTCPAAS